MSQCVGSCGQTMCLFQYIYKWRFLIYKQLLASMTRTVFSVVTILGHCPTKTHQAQSLNSSGCYPPKLSQICTHSYTFFIMHVIEIMFFISKDQSCTQKSYLSESKDTLLEHDSGKSENHLLDYWFSKSPKVAGVYWTSESKVQWI